MTISLGIQPAWVRKATRSSEFRVCFTYARPSGVSDWQPEPLDEKLPQEDADVSTQANRAILTATIREAIDKLTRKQKDVIVLKFQQGLTTGEIADVLRISERGVLKLQQRGLATMRTHVALNSVLDEELV